MHCKAEREEVSSVELNPRALKANLGKDRATDAVGESEYGEVQRRRQPDREREQRQYSCRVDKNERPQRVDGGRVRKIRHALMKRRDIGREAVAVADILRNVEVVAPVDTEALDGEVVQAEAQLEGEEPEQHEPEWPL